MSLSDKQWEFLKDVANLINYAEELDYKLTAGEIYRTRYQQRRYIATGRSQTMNSKHLKRLAIDLNLFIEGDLTYDFDDFEVLGNYWESLNENNVWGGRWKFKDTNHFQRNP